MPNFIMYFSSKRSIKGCRRYLVLTALCVVAFVAVWLTADLGVNPHDLRNQDNQETLNADDNSRISPKKILIVAYYRSGSTLTGSIFADNNDTFYDFEPLYGFHEVTMKTGDPMVYFDGKTRPYAKETLDVDSVDAGTLSSIFNCRYDEVDYVTLKRKLCGVINHSATQFCQCMRYEGREEILTKCIPDYTKLCLRAEYRVIKTIRAGMDTVASVLEKHPDLKVFHLLRDVRGRICSPLALTHIRVSEEQIIEMCNVVQKHIQDRLRLEKTYPETFMEVIYEDLVADPVGAADRMYKFVGSQLPPYVRQIIIKKTMGGEKYDGAYGTTRKNGVETAYKWHSRISWKIVDQVNRHCKSVLDHGEFPKLTSPDDLANFKIPDRRKNNRDGRDWGFFWRGIM